MLTRYYDQHKIFPFVYLTPQISSLLENPVGLWLSSWIIEKQHQIAYYWGEKLALEQEWKLTFEGNLKILKCFDSQGILRNLEVFRREDFDAEETEIDVLVCMAFLPVKLNISPESGIHSSQQARCLILMKPEEDQAPLNLWAF